MKRYLLIAFLLALSTSVFADKAQYDTAISKARIDQKEETRKCKAGPKDKVASCVQGVDKTFNDLAKDARKKHIESQPVPKGKPTGLSAKWIDRFVAFFISDARADQIQLRMPDYNCGGATVGWSVMPDPTNKQAFIVKCADGSAAPPVVVPPTPICVGGSVLVGGFCACPQGTAWNSSKTLCVVVVAVWDGTCKGFTKTIVIDFEWSAPVRKYTGPFSPTDVVVARFTTGNFDSAGNNLPRMSGAEWGTPPSARFAVLSAKPCDFELQAQQGAVSAGNSVQVPFAVGLGNNWGFYPILAKNTMYYFNLKNLSTGETCSASGACDMFIELGKPGGI